MDCLPPCNVASSADSTTFQNRRRLSRWISSIIPVLTSVVRGSWRLRPTVLVAASWTLWATVHTRRKLAAGIVSPLVRRPPALPASAGIGVDAALTRLRATCLESALVRQRWLASHGVERDIVIALPATDFGDTPAHAWLDGIDREPVEEHVEIHRLVVRQI